LYYCNRGIICRIDLGHDAEKDAYRLTYEELIAPIIKAIQELNDRLEIVEEKIG